VIVALPGVFPSHPYRVLDVAAGHGYYGLSILKANKSSHVTFQDWQPVLAVALEHARLEGVVDRCDSLPGSAFEVILPDQSYDIALVINFLHHFEFQQGVELAARLFRSLRSGGQLVAVDFVVNEDHVTPTAAAVFPVSLLATTPHGVVFTFQQFSTMFTSVGFTKIRKIDLPFPGQAAIVAGKS